MQESKYFYDGLPLATYCKNHGINASTIRTRIWKKKQNPVYKDYTEAQIIDMVIKAYGTATKYFYQGQTLNQYCKEHGLNATTIQSRIKRLKETRPDLSDPELVKEVLENYNNKNFLYFYKGMPLVEYCKLHPELSYRTMKSYIKREKTRNPSLTHEQIIQNYIDKEHKGRYRYYYLGIPLIIYCEENNITYCNIISRILRFQSKPENKDFKDDEIVEIVMDNYQPFEPKYLYGGTTLRKYCAENDLSYYSIVSFVKRKLILNPSLNIDDLIDEGVKTINRYGIIYYYHGTPLIDYARQNNLKYHGIKCNILRRLSKSDKPFQEIVDECVETYQELEIKYYYNGETLFSFCRRTGLAYNTIIHRYLTDYKDSGIPMEEAIKTIVENYLINPPMATKYYFHNQSIRSFCNENGYSYTAIYQRIRHLEQKASKENPESIIETAITKYAEKLHINRISAIFNAIKKHQVTTEEEIKQICSFLKIDYENLMTLTQMDFTLNQAINLLWYYGEPTKLNENKIISDKKIEEIFALVSKIENATPQEIDKLSLYDLIAIYKCDLYDTRNEIIHYERKYISHVIGSLCDAKNIQLNKNLYNDFRSEIILYLISVINHTCLNNLGQIIKYLDITIKGSFKVYLNNFMKSYFIDSLNSSKYASDKDSKDAQTKLDFIADPSSNTLEEPEKFSSSMSKALSTLSPEDLEFIILKFQENYSYEELAVHYQTTIEAILSRESNILQSLKEKEEIKILHKTLPSES